LPSIKERLKYASKRIECVAQNPYKEALTLLAFSLHVEPLWLMAHDSDDIEIPLDFFNNIKKRENHYPLEYILKTTSFYSREFYTDERVLIPRPETEILVDKVVSTCKAYKEPVIAEIGVGSGIVSIMLATLLPSAEIFATDISFDALKVAKINAKKHSVSNKIRFVNCNLIEKIDKKIDILVSNPPYIKRGEELDKNLSYEPELALFGGEKGDEILKQIIDEAVKREVQVLVCEMGYDQKDKIANHLKQYNLKADFYKDLAGFERGFVVKSLPR